MRYTPLIFLIGFYLSAITPTTAFDEPIDIDPVETVPVAAIDISDSNGNTIESTVPIGQMIIVSSKKAIHAHKQGSLNWRIRPAMQSFTSPDGETLILNTGLKPQTVEILQIVSLGDKNAYQEISIKIGSAPQPPPDPDVPIDPVDPVVPTPTIGKLSIAIIEEVSDRPLLPPQQQNIFLAPEIREYKNRVCAKDSTGNPEFRVLDKDVDVSNEADWLKKAFAEQRSTLPWIVFSNGMQGYSGPLPKTTEETLTLLKKYGGP